MATFLPFLTEIDPQAAIKGSRDPLGIQTIWSRLGRHVVGNLTTVTTSVRDFTTLILGYYFAERVAELGKDSDDLHVFLRWEQLAAHARYRINNDTTLRGIERVKKAASEGGKIRICADTGQILSNQRTYGLWGLYSGPARASGLVDEGDPTRLTIASRRLVEEVYLPSFAATGMRNADQVVSLLSKGRIDLDAEGKDENFFIAVGKVLQPRLSKKEKELFQPHLLYGIASDKTGNKQESVARAIQLTLDDKDWNLSPARVRHLAKTCRSIGSAGEAASHCLERILVAEQMLAPAAALFDLLMGSDGQTLREVAGTVGRVWGKQVPTIDGERIVELETELRDSTGDVASGQRWVQIAQALAGGNYVDALRFLVEQNTFVMKTRAGGGAWIELAQNRIKVRFRDENPGTLPERDELTGLWRHPYFLNAMRAIALQLGSQP